MRKARALWHAWRSARRETELAYFRRAIKSLNSGDSRIILRDLMHWLDRIHGGDQVARLDVFVKQYGGTHTQVAVSNLVRNLGSPGETPDIAALHDGLAAARTRWRRAQRRRARAHKVLPELNESF